MSTHTTLLAKVEVHDINVKLVNGLEHAGKKNEELYVANREGPGIILEEGGLSE